MAPDRNFRKCCTRFYPVRSGAVRYKVFVMAAIQHGGWVRYVNRYRIRSLRNKNRVVILLISEKYMFTLVLYNIKTCHSLILYFILIFLILF